MGKDALGNRLLGVGAPGASEPLHRALAVPFLGQVHSPLPLQQAPQVPGVRTLRTQLCAGATCRALTTEVRLRAPRGHRPRLRHPGVACAWQPAGQVRGVTCVAPSVFEVGCVCATRSQWTHPVTLTQWCSADS